MQIHRCSWCSNDPLYIKYHDQEWGKPNYNEQYLFEMLCLEGQQAGLSWITVLRKRTAYRQHFFNHPIEKIAQFTDGMLEEKCQDRSLIRHIGKLTAIRDNAIAWQNRTQQNINMVNWLWRFIEDQVHQHNVPDDRQAPVQTEISQKMSKALKQNGFKFVGPTTIYAFMQAVGMVNDHEKRCTYRE